MSEKTYCPACTSYTSSLREAYENGWPCEYCGLSNDAWVEISTIQRARQDDELSQRFTELRVENDKLKRQLHEAHGKLDRLRNTVRSTLGELA
jgi:hypothetical protein